MAGPTISLDTPNLAEFTVRAASLEFTGTYGSDISYDIVIASNAPQEISGAPIENIGNHIAFFNGLFIASLKNSNGIRYSGDGKQWDLASGITTAGNTGIDGSVERDGVLYIATSSGVYSTSDGMSFTRVHNTTVYGIEYGSGMFVATHVGGSVATSTDGVVWTTRPSGGTGLPGSIVFFEGNFIIFRSDGRAYSSADGIAWTSSVLPVPAPASPPSAAVYKGECILSLRRGYPTNNTLVYRVSGSPLSYTVVAIPQGTPGFVTPQLVDDALLIASSSGYYFSYDGARTFSIGLPLPGSASSYVGAIGNGLRVSRVSASSLAVELYTRVSSDSSSKFQNTVDGLDTDPFTSGQKISFTTDPMPTYSTYKYMVRGKGDGEEWGDYSSIRRFLIVRPPNTGVFMQFLT